MGFQFEGMKEMRDALIRLRDGVSEKTDEVLKDHTEDVFRMTQERVPKLTGLLASTGRIEDGQEAHSKIIWYGNSSVEDKSPGVVDYAAAVHEIIGARHDPPTGAKYVEEPLIEGIPNLQEKLGNAYEDLLRG